MKSTICSLYILSVLLFSAFARAEMAMPFAVISEDDTAVYDVEVTRAEGPFALQITGFLSNPCVKKPTAHLIQNPENPSHLMIRLSAPSHNNGMCILPMQGFMTVVDLPEAAQRSEVYIDDTHDYVVTVEGADFQMEIPGQELLRVPGLFLQ